MTIKELETEIEKLKTQCAVLEKELEMQKNNTLPRCKRGDLYWTIDLHSYGPKCEPLRENADIVDDTRYEHNNYFLSEARAKEIEDKMTFLLKLERLHDIYCPDYTPNWHDIREEKFKIIYNPLTSRWSFSSSCTYEDTTTVYFDSAETVELVCDILNEEMNKND